MPKSFDALACAPMAARVASSRTGEGERLARGLGWFSLALGAAAVAAPHGLANAIGVAVEMVQNDAIAKIQQEFAELNAPPDTSQTAASL